MVYFLKFMQSSYSSEGETISNPTLLPIMEEPSLADKLEYLPNESIQSFSWFLDNKGDANLVNIESSQEDTDSDTNDLESESDVDHPQKQLCMLPEPILEKKKCGWKPKSSIQASNKTQDEQKLTSNADEYDPLTCGSYDFFLAGFHSIDAIFFPSFHDLCSCKNSRW